jgi:hypothetical protein
MEPPEQMCFWERSTQPSQGLGHGRRRATDVGFSGSERVEPLGCSLASFLAVVYV